MAKLKALADWLREQGEMKFPEFVVAARAAGHEPAFWHKAKSANLVQTELRNGTLYIKAV